MRYITIILLSVICISCANKDQINLHLPSDLFKNKDTQHCIVSYYNFDCSSCISAMERANEVLKEEKNVFYVISSADSIRTSFYLDKINPSGTVIYDKELKFIQENRHLDFSKDYPIFVVNNGSVIFHEDPFNSFLSEIAFKSKIKDYRAASPDR